MDQNCFASANPQKAIFEAIKAKLENIHTHFPANESNSLQLELADMICLLSAQLALLGQVPQEARLKKRGARGDTEARPPTLIS